MNKTKPYIYNDDKKIKKKYLRLGFGTFQIGGDTYSGKNKINMGRQKLSDSKKAIIKSLKLGINFYDTSDIYGNGESERILGRQIKKLNKKNIVVCTKYGNRIKRNKLVFDYSIKYTNDCVKNSLKRLKRKKIDIFLLHSPPEEMILDEKYKLNILKLKKNKKIQSFGISCRNITSAKKFIKKYDFIDYIEIIYNIIDRRIENSLISLCKKNNIQIIAKVPLASGFLSKKNLKKRFTKTDLRKKFDKSFIKWITKMHDRMKFLEDKNNEIINKGLRFCLSNKNIAAIIPGMRNETQVEENFNSFFLGPLNKNEMTKIRKLPICYPGWK